MVAFTFATTRSVMCEPGASKQLGAHATGVGIQRPLVVTDAGIFKAGILQPGLDSLAAAGLETAVFSDVVADPPEQVIEQALEAARAHDCDGVIGFGGGSAMDTAKLVALLLF